MRKISVDVDLWSEYTIQRCHCKAQGGQDQDGKQLEGLGVAQGGSLFIQRIEKRTKRARSEYREAWIDKYSMTVFVRGERESEPYNELAKRELG